MWFHCVLYLHLDNQITFLLYFLIGMYVYLRRKRKLSCFNSSIIIRNKDKSSAFLPSHQYHFWTTIRDNLFTKDPDTSPKKHPLILSIKVLKSKPERKRRSEMGERKYKWKGKEVGGKKRKKERGKRKGRKILIEQQNKVLDYVQSKVLKSQEKKEEEMSKLKFIPQRGWFKRLSVSIWRADLGRTLDTLGAEREMETEKDEGVSLILFTVLF